MLGLMIVHVSLITAYLVSFSPLLFIMYITPVISFKGVFQLFSWTVTFIFVARQHTDARYWYSNSVRPSLRHVPVSDENGLT